MAEEEAWLALLEAEDVDGFNARRTERSRIELFAADLSEKKLSGVDLSGASLEKSDLTGTDLSDANLMKANLAGIDGSGAILKEAIGLRARFKAAWLDNCDLTNADFTQADFADANLEGSKGEGVRLGQARLRGVNAKGAQWANASLAEAKLHQACFAGADLRNADLSDLTAVEADFTGAQMQGVIAPGAKFPGAKLIGAQLGAARLAGANFSGADLTGADLAAADLSRANLSQAILKNAILRGAVLADATLDGADLTGADLTDADLTGLDPASLGLEAEQVDGLSGFGIQHEANATLVFAEPSIARNGDVVAVLWDNPEGEPRPGEPTEDDPDPEPVQPRVLRYVLFSKGETQVGVVPVPGDAVLDRQIASFGDGFRIVVTRARSDGAMLAIFSLSLEGALAPVKLAPLGYEPAVAPALQVGQGKKGPELWMYALARRGPVLVVHDLTEGEVRPARSEAAATARGFTKGHPVLSCKGGVVVRVTKTGAAKPRRAPDGFPGLASTVLPLGEDLLAVWAVPKVGVVPGGMRYAVIGPRHAPKEAPLTSRPNVLAIAAIEGEEQATVFWLEVTPRGLQLFKAKVPGGEPEPMLEAKDIDELEVAPGVVALVSDTGAITLLDPDSGRVLGVHG